MVDNNVILAGAIPAALMALFADFVLGLIQRSLVRRSVRTRS
jgi:ABC-type proline/glycine betaine transport system permease subunit